MPEGLEVSALPGGNGVLEVTALTLRRGTQGTEVYAALANRGSIPACSAGFAVELFDRDGKSLAAGIGGLFSHRFYQLTDGTDAIAGCIGPGDRTMAAITDLPPDITLEDVRHLVYRCPYFALDVEPVEGLEIDALMRAVSADGIIYTGMLHNRFEGPIRDPSVTVFSLTAGGRPVGSTTVRASMELQPGASWSFETKVLDTGGAEQAAFPAGAL